jgi:hypothetical protein
MTKSRMAALAAVAAFALLLVGGAGPAAAQTPTTTKASQVVAMTGKAKNGKTFRGTFTIQRFAQSAKGPVAVGTLKGRLKGRRVTRRNVRIPASLQQHPAATASQNVPPVTDDPDPTAGACQVLDLVLNPIDLNLLGLRVATSRIEVLVEAVPGGGALLGNLLCAITGILDPGTPALPTPAQPAGLITRVLNALLAILPRTA